MMKSANRSKFTRLGERLTVNVALAFIRLCDEEVRNMSSDVVFVAHGIAAEDFLQAMRNGQQEFRFAKEDADAELTFSHSQARDRNSVS